MYDPAQFWLHAGRNGITGRNQNASGSDPACLLDCFWLRKRHERDTCTLICLGIVRLTYTARSNNAQSRVQERSKGGRLSWTLKKKLAQKRSRAGRWCWARERESWTPFASVVSQRRSYGHCGSVLHSSWDSNCVVPDGHCLNILLFWRRSTAALVFRVGACFEVSLFCPPFPTQL